MKIDDRVAAVMFTSLMAGMDFDEAGVPDTKANRAAWDDIAASLDAVPEGMSPEMVSEWVGDEYDEMIGEVYDDVYHDELARLIAERAAQKSATLVSKSVDEDRFTLGPMYVPNRMDAHGEWTDADELQKAVWRYVKSGDRRIRLQHNRDVVAGELVEIMAWPYEVEAPIMQKSGGSVPMRFPANTVFLGVQWEPWAWEMVKTGKILGYSIGGKAERLLVDLPEEP